MPRNKQISIIICSRRPNISANLKQNIAETIGCEYELIVIDNSHDQYNIFQAYNEGIKRSQGDVLCFMHEDILYRSKDWGTIVLDVFEDKTIGLVGFAGTHFLSSSPFYWTNSPFISEHNLTNDKGVVLECFKDEYYDTHGLADLVAIDGFCFFVKKQLFEYIRFDDNTYSGYHAYDMDICMQVIMAGYRVCACNKVLIEHFWSESDSGAKKGYELLDYNLELFANKYKDNLPIHIGVEGIPDYVWERIDGLMKNAYESKRVRKSMAYKTGKLLLTPFKWIKQ